MRIDEVINETIKDFPEMRFIAQDLDGLIYLYRNPPVKGNCKWNHDGETLWIPVGIHKKVEDWGNRLFDLNTHKVKVKKGLLCGKPKIYGCAFTHVSFDDPQPPGKIHSCKCKSEIYPYKYIAQNFDGEMFLYKDKPYKATDKWRSNSSSANDCIPYIQGSKNQNWKNTLNNLTDGKGYKIISGQLVERTSSVKARWEASGKAPIVQFANIHTDWKWTFYDLDSTPWWHENSVYRIHPESEGWKKSDKHYDLRKKWLLSDKKLPIQVEGFYCKTGWGDLDPSEDISWYSTLLYREKPKSIKLVSRRYVAKSMNTGNLIVLVRNLRELETKESAEKATQESVKFVKWYDKEWQTYTYNPG